MGGFAEKTLDVMRHFFCCVVQIDCVQVQIGRRGSREQKTRRMSKYNERLWERMERQNGKGRARTSDQAGKSPRFALPLSYFP